VKQIERESTKIVRFLMIMNIKKIKNKKLKNKIKKFIYNKNIIYINKNNKKKKKKKKKKMK
jgi:hypothetical protein